MKLKQYHHRLQKWTAIGILSGFLIALPVYRYAFIPNRPWELAIKEIGLLAVILWLLFTGANWLLCQSYKRKIALNSQPEEKQT